MKLLTSVLPRSGRLLPAGVWFTLGVCGFLIGLEVAGRYAATDISDGVAALLLLIVILGIAARHRKEPLGWVRGLGNWGRRVGGSLSGLRYDHGIDLRGTPPLPRRTPPAVWYLATGLVVWGGLALAAWALYPAGWRAASFYTSYVLYLAILLGLWATLLAVTLLGVFLPVHVLDKWLQRWLGDINRRGAEITAVVIYACLVSGIACTIPPTWILGICLAVSAGAWLVYFPKGADGAAVLWRTGPAEPIYAVPVHRVLALIGGLGTLLVFDLLLTACGGRLFGGPRAEDTMPVTALFGSLAAWFMPGLLAVLGLRLAASRRNDPARRTVPTVHVSGSDPLAVRRAVRAIRGWAWRVSVAPTPRTRAEVGVAIVPQVQSEATEFDPRWPLKVSAADLEDGKVKMRLDRRDEIQVRRMFFRGLQKLLKRASAFKSPGGGGFWLAPHWWFVDGVGREDGDDSAPPLVGPPYHRVLPARARQHAHAFLRAGQVDMIFVEDGVTFRNLERVLRVLTELYDVHGGKRRAEEHHFRGLPKVKVMLHEYEPGNPFRSELYPEPKFDDLSRVRVLHIFRDRGGHEEYVEPPFDFSWSPAPALAE